MRTFFIFSLILFLSIAVEAQEKLSTKADNVTVLKKQFKIEGLNNNSYKIWLYLPPNYKTTSKNFPVIYMTDAQNLFDNATSYAGEWNVDEHLNEIYAKTKKGFIVVGIENGGEERINEYTPWKHTKYGGGKGATYINWIVNTLKPYIDANYRTKTNAKNTALIGSSLGGLISYYGGLKHPNVFGKIGALSTSFWFSNQVYTFTEKANLCKKQKRYLLVGGKEGSDMVADSKKMYKKLIGKGIQKNKVHLKINPEGEHNEAFWSSEFKEVITWLFNIK